MRTPHWVPLEKAVKGKTRAGVTVCLALIFQSFVKMIIEIESKDDFDKALEEAGDKLVVVDFTALWCGPCQTIAPFFKKLSEEHTTVVFLKVDVDIAQDVAAFCDIKCMPTFHLYKNKTKVDEFSGSNQAKLEELVTSNK